MALAGGWIDQPFVSQLNPTPPGSMVVVAMEPDSWFMERAGMATGTRNVALRLWNGKLPDRSPAQLVRELYSEENRGRSEPSGSQDMIGLLYPGINRLDYDFACDGGVFPRHIESNNDPRIHFGLGDATRVDEVEIHWPDRTVEKVALPSVDKIFTIEEGKGVTGSTCATCKEKKGRK